MISITPKELCQACNTNKTRKVLFVCVCDADYQPGRAGLQQLLINLKSQYQQQQPPAAPPTNNTPLPPPQTQTSGYEIEQLLHQRINELRVKEGRIALIYDNDLAQIAESHSMNMQRDNFYSHTDKAGNTVGRRASKFGYPWSAISENIGYVDYRIGSNNPDHLPDDDKDIVQHILFGLSNDPEGWWTSPPHKANILNSTYNRHGLGVWIVGDKVWQTQVLAKKKI